MIDYIEEVSKRFDYLEEVRKFNPYHGADGRFASAGGAASFTYAPGKSKHHDMAIKREKAKDFHNTIAAAKQSVAEKSRWRVDVHDAKDYVEDKVFTTKGGSCFAVKADGDIISVCHKEGDPTRGKELLRMAVENGGTKLDSFGGNHDFYQKCGFSPVSWTPFSDDPAIWPEGWKESGAPKEPVVFYKYTGKNTKLISLEEFTKKNAPYLDDGDGWGYDKAMKARDDSMK